MTDFASAPAALPRLAPLDPTKHVNYTLGMVLGVDDFEQEFSLPVRHETAGWRRDLSGLRHVWGLAVTHRGRRPTGPRVNVAPGAAVTPCGQLVCVSPAQCASLNDWLRANEELAPRHPARRPRSPACPCHVVLCYRECPTDDLPIPGEPCRTEDTLSAPSRLKDDFRLELRTSHRASTRKTRCATSWRGSARCPSSMDPDRRSTSSCPRCAMPPPARFRAHRRRHRRTSPTSSASASRRSG